MHCPAAPCKFVFSFFFFSSPVSLYLSQDEYCTVDLALFQTVWPGHRLSPNHTLSSGVCVTSSALLVTLKRTIENPRRRLLLCWLDSRWDPSRLKRLGPGV